MHNTIQEFSCHTQEDPLILRSGTHCLFYSPAVPIVQIKPLQTLTELINLANTRLARMSKEKFTADLTYADWMANIVKINLMVQGLDQHGIVKPMLLSYNGSMPMTPNTGDSRLKALTCRPTIQSVPAIISTGINHVDKFSDLQQVGSLDQLAQVCELDPQFARFWLRFNDTHGLDWFEYSADQVAVPDIAWCLNVLQTYLDQQPTDFQFTQRWFAEPHAWS